MNTSSPQLNNGGSGLGSGLPSQRPGDLRRIVSWPGDAALAATIGVALEAFDKQSQVRLAGDRGIRDEFSLSYGEYGYRVGVWRILDILDDFEVKASFSISGKLAHERPDVVRAVTGAGHDLVAHGWVNDQFLMGTSADEERDLVERTMAAIESASGRRPTGWASPANSSSSRTKEILLDAGVVWSGDDASDDLPYVEQIGARRLVVLPKANLSANDLIHWVLPTNSTSVFYEGFAASFDTLYEEGRSGRPQWAEMILHCHMAGRPSFVPALKQALRLVREHNDVWCTTKSELARWTLEKEFVR